MDVGDSRNGASLSEEAQCGGPRGKAPLLENLGYEWRALEIGISFHEGSVGQTWSGLVYCEL